MDSQNSAELAERGRSLIQWAECRMPALAKVGDEMDARGSLHGVTIGGSLHLTPETAALARCLKRAGAEVVLCGSNPLSTRDEICASLARHDGMAVFASYKEDRDAYYRNLRAVAVTKPDIVLDDGADLIAYMAEREAAASTVGIEQTTTGVQRLVGMQKAGVLPFPVIALNQASVKHEFDNTYGTGQNTIDGILRATNILIAGKTVVVAGYGWVGSGIASRMRGHGANVIVAEVNPMRALHAYYDGFKVLPMAEAAPLGDVLVTATGCREVIAADHLEMLKDGAVLANSGHFDVEIDVAALETMALASDEVRPNLVQHTLPGGKRVYLLARGRLVGQSSAEASPADVMDLTFTLMAMTVEWARQQEFASNQVLMPPAEFTELVASMKLAAMGVSHDQLTPSQREYIESWTAGT